VLLPQGFKAEIYNENNKVVRSEEKNFKISPNEKAVLKNETGHELQIYWRAKDARINRTRAEQDNQKFRSTLAISLGLSIAVILLMSFLQKPSEILEEASAPKSSYLRFTTQASAPAAASGGAESEKSEAPAAAPSKTAAITSMISQLVSKKAVTSGEQAVAVGTVGKQSIRASNGEFAKQDIASNIGNGSGIDAKAMGSALAQAGSGGAKGLGGFGKGGVGVGTAAFGSVNGTGFSLNVGGDDAEAVGGLDKSLIAAVVQANIGQIKHCYERQLLVDSNLFGKVVAQWTIDKDGNVPQSSVKKTTLNSEPVEKCILGKIRNWQFPKPKGGGQVFVSYPFLFKSTN
jgi:hypothetical protein